VMDNLLVAIHSLLKAKFVTADASIRAVYILDESASEAVQKSNNLPAMVVLPIEERHEPGPMMSTARQIYQIGIHIVAQSVDPETYLTKQTIKNVPILVKEVRDLLYQNKKITADTFELRPQFTVRYNHLLYRDILNGHSTSCDIIVEYTELEAYTGMQNEQSTLAVPDEFLL